jgi:hypothetical protein
LFASTIRKKLCNKPDKENRTLDYDKACLKNLGAQKNKRADPSGRLLAGIAGSNPAGRMNVCYECCVLSDLSATGRSLV